MKISFIYLLLVGLFFVPVMPYAQVSAQCDPSPCEQTAVQVNVTVQTDTSAAPDDQTTQSYQANFIQINPDQPTNTDISQANVAVIQADYGAGDDSVGLGQENISEVNKDNADGDDNIDQSNVAVIEADMGDDDDTVGLLQTNTQRHNAPDEHSGNDTFSSTNIAVVNAALGVGNDSLMTYQETVIENNSPGADSLQVTQIIVANVDAGSGNDTLSFDSQINVQQQGQPVNNNLQITNLLVGDINGGEGDDSVTLRSNRAVISRNSTDAAGLLIDGGPGDDTLVLDYDAGKVSESEANAISRYLAANSSSGTLTVNGIVYTWVNFEELVNLIRFAIEQGSDSGGFSITFTDGRLNYLDVAAPVAIYCANGGFTVWQIDPQTGNGTQVISASLDDLHAGTMTGGRATMVLTDEGRVLVTSGAYSYSFEPVVCGAT